MRKTITWNLWLCLAIATLCGVAFAQVPKPATGTVTGHVICQDTQRPARFAQVSVFSVPAVVTPFPGKVDGTSQKSVDAFLKAQQGAISSQSFVLAETGFDGSFSIDGIAPGDYYVMASVGGYVQPQEIVQAAVDEGQDITKGISGIPMVRVSADRAVDAEISVARGGAVEGHVLWDDGSPINGAMVLVEPKTGEHKQLPMQFTMMMMNGQSSGNTDDRGHYRISGLAPGEYTARVMLQTSRHMAMQGGRFDARSNFGGMPLTVYAPRGFRRTDAKPFTLTAGEERTDEDVTFNLSATHTVSGRVTSAEDHHGLNRGVVMLTDATDKTFRRSAGVDADGNFSITFVPSGTYTMSIMNGADTVPQESKKTDSNVIFSQTELKTVRTYEKAEQQILLAGDDLTGQNIELKPVKSSDSGDETGNQ